jgi:hypothetical protein
MQNRTTFLAGALGLLLLGCSVLAQYPSPPNQTLKPVKIEGVPAATKHPIERYSVGNCLEKRCYFTVRVDHDCQISLDPQWMGISRRNKEVTLVWEIKDSTGFTFAQDPILNKPRPEDKDNPFRAVKRLADGNVVEVAFQNNPGHARDYGIKIQKGTTVCGVLDPPVYPDV